MDRVEEGVSNFRQFQMDMREYVTDAKATEKEREKQHKENKDRLNIIIGILGLIIAYLVYATNAKKEHSLLNLHGSNQPVVSEYHAQE